MNCPECGAADGACEARFNEFLVLEFTDAGYGAVHNLTVATYMLQHSSKLTREGWLYERQLLRDFIIENKPPAFVRVQNKDKVDSGKREFKIKSKTGERIISKSTWNKTILDVRTDSAEVYCADVNDWAMAVLKDAETIYDKSLNRIKLKGVLPKTATWVYFDDKDNLVVEHYDFSEDAQNSFGRDVAFLIKISQSQLKRLMRCLNGKEHSWNPVDNLFSPQNYSQMKEQILGLVEEKFLDYYEIQKWLLTKNIKFEKTFDD